MSGHEIGSRELFLLARWGRVEFRDLDPNFHIHLSGDFPRLECLTSFRSNSRSGALDLAVAHTVEVIEEIASIDDSIQWLAAHGAGETSRGRELLAREIDRRIELQKGLKTANGGIN